ncbi:MAG: hypothetical protein GX096_01505 [Clostridiales bacterium]|nr:hypothetical protein [Clostridiales bacterium]
MIRTELEQIKAVLSAIDGVTLVSTTWPASMDTLPAIIIRLAGESAADQRDDSEYLTRMQWYVHVFAPKEKALMDISSLAHKAMEGIGYTRTLRWDDHTDGAAQVVFRFSKTMVTQLHDI